MKRFFISPRLNCKLGIIIIRGRHSDLINPRQEERSNKLLFQMKTLAHFFPDDISAALEWVLGARIVCANFEAFFLIV